MKAYISKWYDKGWRIGPINYGGAVEVELDIDVYDRLITEQRLADRLQRDLAGLTSK